MKDLIEYVCLVGDEEEMLYFLSNQIKGAEIGSVTIITEDVRTLFW